MEVNFKYLTESERKVLFQAIDMQEENLGSQLEMKALFALGLDLGCRVTEIREVPNQDLGNTLSIRDSKQTKATKKGEPYRLCVISDNTLAIVRTFRNYLKEKKDGRETFFPYSCKTINRRVKQYFALAGIQRENPRLIRWHIFRHTYIQASITARVPLKAVAQQTGDAITTLLRYYNEYSPEQRLGFLKEANLVPSNGT